MSLRHSVFRINLFYFFHKTYPKFKIAIYYFPILPLNVRVIKAGIRPLLQLYLYYITLVGTLLR